MKGRFSMSNFGTGNANVLNELSLFTSSKSLIVDAYQLSTKYMSVGAIVMKSLFFAYSTKYTGTSS